MSGQGQARRRENAHASVDASGDVDVIFKRPFDGRVWEGTVSVPLSGATVSWTIYLEDQAVATFPGSSGVSGVQVAYYETLHVKASGLTPGDVYIAYFSGRDVPEEEIIWAGPLSIASAVVTSGQPHGSQVFSYTGGNQTFVVPSGVTSLIVDAFGASAGNTGAAGVNVGGLGGRTLATVTVVPGETLRLIVGGRGVDGVVGIAAGRAGGFNGGGVSGGSNNGGGAAYTGSSGGGSSDVRRGAFALADRMVIAGGGGGAAGTSTLPSNGGAGGGATSAGGVGAGGTGGVGTGFDSTGNPGVLGTGGAAGGTDVFGAGSGGGGFYGGGASSGGGFGATASGGGGSINGQPGNTPASTMGSGGGGGGWADATATAITGQNGVQTGNGVITLTW